MKSKNQETLFIETIKLHQGKLHNLAYHNARANTARREVLKIKKPLILEEHIAIEKYSDNKLYKCRVTFGEKVVDVKIEPYRKKKIKMLRLVEGGDIDYGYKYADRASLDSLFEKRAGADDILIIRNGLITDTSYANVAFFDGLTWHTPAEPLLKGTKRQQLLDAGMLKSESIRIDDVLTFSHIVLFNAMIEFDPREAIKTEAVLPPKVD